MIFAWVGVVVPPDVDLDKTMAVRRGNAANSTR
jgi:hypothetical protein